MFWKEETKHKFFSKRTALWKEGWFLELLQVFTLAALALILTPNRSRRYSLYLHDSQFENFDLKIDYEKTTISKSKQFVINFEKSSEKKRNNKGRGAETSFFLKGLENFFLRGWKVRNLKTALIFTKISKKLLLSSKFSIFFALLQIWSQNDNEWHWNYKKLKITKFLL